MCQVQRGACWDLRSEIQTKKTVRNVEKELTPWRGSPEIWTQAPASPDSSSESIPVRLRTGLDWTREKQDWPWRKQLGVSALVLVEFIRVSADSGEDRGSWRHLMGITDRTHWLHQGMRGKRWTQLLHFSGPWVLGNAVTYYSWWESIPSDLRSSLLRSMNLNKLWREWNWKWTGKSKDHRHVPPPSTGGRMRLLIEAIYEEKRQSLGKKEHWSSWIPIWITSRWEESYVQMKRPIRSLLSGSRAQGRVLG